MYKLIIRPLFFLFDPEKIHHFTFSLVKFISKIPLVPLVLRSLYHINDTRLTKELFGLTFKNPVGLAAGFDKNALLYNELANFGFGFVEIGTVTPKGQEGNPKKRLFRLKEDNGIINRMGFNNEGLEAVIKQLKKNKGAIIIGGNIGKNTNTSPDHYTDDYLACFKGLYPYVDYFVLNVSCPNVGSHAKLDDVLYLKELITKVQEVDRTLSVSKGSKSKPILLKIAPDLNNHQLDEIIQLIKETKIAGVIASNTSVSRAHLKTSKERLLEIGNGGVSGQPVKDKSTKVINYLATKSNKAFSIIGVGGIHSEKDALEKIEAGADLVQIYTGFIYEGPRLVKRINKAILKKV
ncbi:quinone-dependent dihydroorotate dehydrogenase [Tenacibaculum maritimum]|uniref:quinone-dependent dihydroorotate dehydrogenase n=1 Tax=Tenacibaculum maritimum TaxID=107401 RepID=UPI0013303BFD|nr:quinone-dependent dihydroorotate dehydrogenase [Tenacibaculum maritimum]MCD9580431.1 quinone-dependent dihydroorotate dehydrogenase [Tenacibaculum maritimum]MCD9635414.1 quinone-dependent dihydroorotate dehydrogenase [Tenacibaculum maritimum]MDB0603527.1 quinone-dependent dihydroorotate dehydrogenase [Tenacibaculum maritimum]MDB0612498.1 quinone-dependent dihydroorotate dehydrogenase [Tenacibaculum maritimum]